MSMDAWVPWISRWIHLLSVITLMGGSIFMRLVLAPAAKGALSDDHHQKLRDAIRPRWAMFSHGCVALILLSGTYNAYLGLTAHSGQPLYHGLFGVKLLLAMLVFFLAIALTGRSEAFAGIRKHQTRWLSVAILAAVAIVLISGVLRQIPLGSTETL
jgi:uncharacterized membrane protein